MQDFTLCNGFLAYLLDAIQREAMINGGFSTRQNGFAPLTFSQFPVGHNLELGYMIIRVSRN